MDNSTYIKGLLEHDNRVLAAIYQNFSPKIRQFVVKRGGTAEDAKDVFQDALMVIYNKAKSKDFELTSQFSTYLYGICRFIWDRKRKKMANNTVTFPEDDRYISEKDIEADLLHRERHNVFRHNFLKLKPFCQKLLKYFYDKKSMSDIAQLMGLKNEHTARNRKYRCQKSLEVLIKKDGRFEELKAK